MPKPRNLKLESMVKVCMAFYPTIMGTREKALVGILLENMTSYDGDRVIVDPSHIVRILDKDDPVNYPSSIKIKKVNQTHQIDLVAVARDYERGRVTDAQLIDSRFLQEAAHARKKANEQAKQVQEFKNKDNPFSGKCLYPICHSYLPFDWGEYHRLALIEEQYRCLQPMREFHCDPLAIQQGLPDGIPQDWLEGIIEILFYLAGRKPTYNNPESLDDYNNHATKRNEEAIAKADTMLRALIVRFKERLPQHAPMVANGTRQKTRDEILKDVFDNISQKKDQERRRKTLKWID